MPIGDVVGRRCPSRRCRHLGHVDHRVLDEGEDADTWWVAFQCVLCAHEVLEEWAKEPTAAEAEEAIDDAWDDDEGDYEEQWMDDTADAAAFDETDLPF